MRTANEHPGVKYSGAPNWEELVKSPGYPREELWRKGPIAFIECVEEIPCNPCEFSCARGAIEVGMSITNLPVLEGEKCIGCGICVAACPGLAIYIKDYTHKEAEASITFPYEYWPLPQKGQEVVMVDELGQEVCGGVVIRILETKQNNHTPLITVSYPKEHFLQVKSMKRL